MQTKSVLTALSLSILCSSTAFGMLPRLGAAAMRQAARQAGKATFRPGMRQLPRSGAPRRFFSDNAAAPSAAKPRTKWSAGEKALLSVGVGIGAFGVAFGPNIWSNHRQHQAELKQERKRKRDKEKAAKERTQDVLEIVIRDRLPQKTIGEIEEKVAATQNPFWPAYKQERYRLLCESYIKQFKKPEDEPEARHAKFHGFTSRKTT